MTAQERAALVAESEEQVGRLHQEQEQAERGIAAKHAAIEAEHRADNLRRRQFDAQALARLGAPLLMTGSDR